MRGSSQPVLIDVFNPRGERALSMLFRAQLCISCSTRDGSKTTVDVTPEEFAEIAFQHGGLGLPLPKGDK